MKIGRYNHLEQMEKWNKHWKEINLYEKNSEKHKQDPKYFYIDGPPYANAPPHMGHAFTRVLRETMLKYKQMKGHNVWLQLGFDTHGLPVSTKVQKELGLKTNEDIENYGIDKFNEACKKHATKFLDLWLKFYEEMGSLSLWNFENRYFTFKNEYIDSTWLFFQKAKEKDLIYKGKMTVPWCHSCETALSSHEASEKYKDVEDTSIFIKFPLKDEPNTYFLVWTTTPWTLPGNVAIAVNPKYEYSKVKTIDGYLIIAKELVEKAMEIIEQPNYEIVETMTGKDLAGKEYKHLLEEEVPIHKNFKHKIITTDYVTIEEGTGLVHTAPGHGPDDYDAGIKYGLEIICPVNAQGKFTEEGGKYKGEQVFKANKIILEDLEKNNLLAKAIKIKHRYAHCPRCEGKLIYRTSPQWFVKIKPIKEKMLSENKKVKWAPDWVGEKRFQDWLENARDWCISRQKYWGTPLPIWECECGKIEIIGSLKELKQKSKNCPENLELHKPYVDKVTLPCKCGKEMKRVPDIADVWLDSGAATWAALEYPENKEFEQWYPMDFITEGLDQTRGWFYTLMIENIVVFDKAPYKAVQVNGLILDDKGEKMSKSKGNVTDPIKTIEKNGADIIRWYLLWNTSPWENSKYDEGNMKTIKAAISTIWNLYSFINKFYENDNYNNEKAELEKEDKWILSKLELLKKKTEQAYETMNPYISARELRNFIVDDLSRDYIKFIRNRLKNNKNKEGVYYTLHLVMKDLTKIMSPITPFISEEIYQGLIKEKESIHLENWPNYDEEKRYKQIEEKMEKVKQVIEAGLAKRNEEKINLRQPLAKLTTNIEGIDEWHYLIKEQVNVKEIAKGETLAELDTQLTPELEKEGLTREVTRRVQQMRKEMKLVEADEITLSINPKPDINFKNLQKTTNSKEILDSLEGQEKTFKIKEIKYKITARKQ